MQGNATYPVASSPRRAADMVCFLLGNAVWCCFGQCDFLVSTYRSAISLALGIPRPSKAMFEDRKKSAACVEE
jgi:hypothetical protein